MKSIIFKFLFLSFTLIFSSCAILHHVQLGEIVQSKQYVATPFDIKYSETGIDIGELKEVSKVFLSKQGDKVADDVAAIVGLFQMGPRTGNTVYNKDYAKTLISAIYEKCPSGNVTGLTSIRETRKYPVISGEIVKVTGYCLTPKGG